VQILLNTTKRILKFYFGIQKLSLYSVGVMQKIQAGNHGFIFDGIDDDDVGMSICPLIELLQHIDFKLDDIQSVCICPTALEVEKISSSLKKICLGYTIITVCNTRDRELAPKQYSHILVATCSDVMKLLDLKLLEPSHLHRSTF
jgi:hypothetical protein